MKHFFLIAFLLLVVGSFLTPTPVQAEGLIPCGRNIGTEAERSPCTVCHIIVGGNGLVTWGLKIMTTIAVTVIFAMGVLYIVSAGNPGMMEKAKGGIWAALIGFGIMLAAWLIINVILTTLVSKSKEPFMGLISTGAFTFSCDTISNSRYGK